MTAQSVIGILTNFPISNITEKSNTTWIRNARHPERQKKCSLCSDKFSKAEIIRHFEKEHGLKIKESLLEFPSFDEFQKWKDEEEKKRKLKFVHETGRKRRLSTTHYRFACHRSGEFKSRGKRHKKTQGSKKMGGYCPASICTTQYNDGKCSVVYKSTHVGHENDLEHLLLSISEKELIATKIASEIPFNTILNEIRDSVSESSLERIHLLTKRDLFNIKAEFKKMQSSADRHQKYDVSIESWVTEMEDLILVYKPQDVTVSEYPELNKSDFALGIMNDAQAEILKKFGNDLICLDRTYGMKASDFQLITILILDDKQKAFPCAFFLCNRTDEKAISIFLKAVKGKIGDISPKVFMSDIEDSLFNTWENIMGIPKSRLLCTWHVDRAWRINLNKILGKENQADVYKALRCLLEEGEVDIFNVLFPKLLNEWKENPDTVEFANYIISDSYLKYVSSWAYCYRLNAGIDTNMQLQLIHKTLKYVFLNEKNARKPKTSINAMMTFVKDKMIDRLATLSKDKITSKLHDLRNRHKSSLALSVHSVQENNRGWSVISSEATEFYQIQKSVTNCTCQLQCQDCDACVHNYTCTCIDSAVKWNMCKHIHLVCRITKLKTVPMRGAYDESDDLHINDVASIESQTIIELEKNELTEVAYSNLSIESYKNIVAKEFYDLLDLATTREEVEAVERLVMSARKKILAMQKKDRLPDFRFNFPKKVLPENP